MCWDDRGIRVCIVSNLVIEGKDNKEVVDIDYNGNPFLTWAKLQLPPSTLGINLLQHINPASNQCDEKDRDKQGLNKDAKDIRVEYTNKIVRIVEENNRN